MASIQPPYSRALTRVLAGSCLTAVLAASGSARAGQFTDVTSDAGLDYVHHVLREAPDCVGGIFCETERMSGGVAVADIDGDHLLDLFVTRTDAPDILWRNRGDGTFEDVTLAAGLAAFNLQSNGAGFADIDNDGDPDLYVAVMDNSGVAPNNRNYLFVNDGSGVFTEEAVARGVDLTSARRRRSYSVAVGDFDRDGWLDLHTTEWLPSSKPHASLFRNLGAAAPGHFEDVTEAAGVGLVDSASFGSSMTDLDNDGWPDLAVVADFGTSRLFWNQGNGTFVEGTAAANVATDENGMGSTFGDFDGDGLLDWFVTSIFDADETCASLVDCNWGHSGNRLYRNEGGRVFSDATDAAGVRIGFWGWGAAFFDFDNDADLDLVMTNGVNFPITDKETSFHADPMRLWVNDGSGVFSEESAARGVTDTGSGKGLVVFDYDDDGDLDIFVVNNAAAPVLYRNDGGNHNDWLRVRAVGVDSNRDGIGTRLWLHEELGGPVQMRDIGSATHFLGQSELTAHFGLGDGDAPIALLQVAWPSGLVQELVDVPRNQTLILVEGDCLDGDGDGFCEDVDCDDTDPDVHPAAVDRPGDSLDENCDGVPACDPDAKWKHHKLVDCVVKECRALTRAHLLSKKECREIVHDVAYCPDGHAAKHHGKHHGKHRGKHHGKKHGKKHGKHHRKDHCEPVHHGKKHGKG